MAHHKHLGRDDFHKVVNNLADELKHTFHKHIHKNLRAHHPLRTAFECSYLAPK